MLNLISHYYIALNKNPIWSYFWMKQKQKSLEIVIKDNKSAKSIVLKKLVTENALFFLCLYPSFYIY